MSFIFKNLDKSTISKYLDKLVILDVSIGHEIGAKYGNDPWNATNFMGDYSKKWEFSQIAISKDENEIGGFVVASEALSQELHIHRFAVDPHFRRSGLGGVLIGRLLDVAKRHKCHRMTVDVNRLNSEAILFYQRFDFKPLEREGLKSYALLRKKGIRLIDNFIRDVDGSESYILQRDIV